MLNIVQATFPNEDYNGEHAQNHGKPKSAGAELAFKWRKVDGLVQAKARGAQLRKEHMKPLIVDVGLYSYKQRLITFLHSVQILG